MRLVDHVPVVFDVCMFIAMISVIVVLFACFYEACYAHTLVCKGRLCPRVPRRNVPSSSGRNIYIYIYIYV